MDNYQLEPREVSVRVTTTLVAHLVKNYTYDAERGVVVNRKLNRVVKGAVNSRGYVKTRLWIGGQHPTIGLHQMVWVVVHGRLPSQIDHINGNPLDNRLENLREVSSSENMLNIVHRWKPNARTGLPGVDKHGNKYRISSSGECMTLSDKYEAFFHSVLFGRMFKEL